MRFGMSISMFRLTLLAPAVLVQLYLFFRARRAIRSSKRSERFKAWTTRLVGAAIGLLFIANACILFKPIPWLDPPAAAQVGLFYPAAIWNLGSIFSALLLLIVQVAGGLKRMVVRLFGGLTNRAAPVGMNPGRRRFLRAGVGGLAAAPFLLSGYGAAYAAKAYEIRELSLPFGRRVRVVQLTDIHSGIYMSREEMRRYAEQANALQPDVFVLTGDYISNSMLFLPPCVEEMARVRARYGCFATLGNHEHWYGQLEEVQAVFGHHGIPLLQNSHQVIQTPEGPFAVAGIDDLRSGDPDLPAALRGIAPGIPTILLSHRPEIFPQAAADGIALTLSGHYHGGQIKLSLPGGDLSIAHLRTPYPEGLYRINDAHLYVSRGIGTTFTPVRLNAPPEVTLFQLK
jgi:predicted MPP superfamily phosphohydrolase